MLIQLSPFHIYNKIQQHSNYSNDDDVGDLLLEGSVFTTPMLFPLILVINTETKSLVMQKYIIAIK